MECNYELYTFCYIIAIFAISWIMVFAEGPFMIVEKFRNMMSSINDNIKTLFSCMMCMPVQVSMLLSILSYCTKLYFTPAMVCFNLDWYIGIPFDMFLGGGCTYIINTILETFEALTNKLEK